MKRWTAHLDGLDQEIRDHIDAETRENIARGMQEDDARAAALRKFGNVARVKEDARDVWVLAWWDRGRQDARDAIRRVRRNPGVALAIVVTLALGIGLTTAIFSVVNAVLLRPLSYPHPDRVVWLTTRGAQPGSELMNGLDFADWRAQATTFEHMVAYAFSDSTVVAEGEASRWRVMMASDGFWDLSGARAVLGTLPAADDPDLLVLSHRVFREQFQSDPQVIGRTVTVDGQQATIAAVLAEDFRPQLPEWLWRPGLDRLEVDAYQGLVPPTPPVRRDLNQMVPIYLAIGQLKADVTVEQARAELETIHASIQQAHPTSPFGLSSVGIVPLGEKLVGPSRRALRILLAAALVVLLITCANVASLLWSRSAVRQKEMALRMAVGSGPLRIVRQLLAESVGYALLGGAGGVWLAWWLVNVIVGTAGQAVPRLTEATLDFQVLGFATVTSLLTAVIFGIGPALSLGHTHVQEVLKEGARGASASRRVRAAGRLAVGVQLALTVVLVIGAGLMLKSVWRMTSYPAGFTPAEILTLRTEFSGPAYREDLARHAYAAALLDVARSFPGVHQAELTTGRDGMTLIIKEGDPLPEDPEAHVAAVSAVTPGFAPMLGMSLAGGRWLNEFDQPGALLVNEALVRRHFSNPLPIGARIQHPGLDDGQYGTIVGIVRDLKYARVDVEAEPEIFVHHRDRRPFGVTLALHIEGDPLEAAPAITKALAAVDPTQSIFSVKTLEQTLDDSIAPRRFNLMLLSTFAIVATVLAALGVYAVIAYSVAERTHEIGIRLALGAERNRVVRMIVQEGIVSIVRGIAAGLVVALAASRLMSSLLYDVEATDGPTFVVVALGLTVVGFAACALPALRAAFVEPVSALRSE
jgi:putative ABC transport system permease protein